MRFILGYILLFLFCFTIVSLYAIRNRRWKLIPALLILTCLLAGPGTLIREKTQITGTLTVSELLEVLPMALCILSGGNIGWIVGVHFRRILDAEKADAQEQWKKDDPKP